MTGSRVANGFSSDFIIPFLRRTYQRSARKESGQYITETQQMSLSSLISFFGEGD